MALGESAGLHAVAAHPRGPRRGLVPGEIHATPVVIALKETGARPGDLDRLPRTLKTALWPKAGDPDAPVGLTADRLAQVSGSLVERLEGLGELDALWDSVLSEAAIPPPGSLAGTPVFALPASCAPASEPTSWGAPTSCSGSTTACPLCGGSWPPPL